MLKRQQVVVLLVEMMAGLLFLELMEMAPIVLFQPPIFVTTENLGAAI